MQDRHAGCSQVEVLPTIGQSVYLATPIDRGDCDDRLVGRREHRLRHRTTVAGGGQDHDISLTGSLQGALQQSVGRAREAEVDHLDARRYQTNPAHAPG